jgi:hypothetical protein
MILHLSPLGLLHTALSIVALVSGLGVVAGLLRSERMPKTTAIFMASALAATLTGFRFLEGGFGPARILTMASLAVLVIAALARYVFHLVGRWSPIYAATATLGVYFLAFFTIAESFKRIPALKALAPTLTEPPFKIVQAATLLLFLALAFVTARSYRDKKHNPR